MMNFIDRAEITDGTLRKTADGYVVAEVPVARTGIQDYAGYEVGKPDMQRVRVYRPASEVFADEHLVSIAHKPVTSDHPKGAVTPATWKRDAVGFMGGEIRKDEAAGLIHVPLLFADASAISELERGKREVSMGYSCDLDWTAGVTDDGQEYDAVQRGIRANHVALVNKGRAGYSCRVGDNWTPINDDKEPVVATKIITFDGLPVEVTDAAEAVINKLTEARDALKSELTAAQATEGTLTATVATKDGEIAALNAQLDDAKVTPEKLAKLVADRAKLIADAKKVAGTDPDEGDDDAAMKRKAVKAKMGDAADALSDAAIDGAFAAYVAAKPTTDAFREIVKDGVTADADAAAAAARQAMIDRIMNPLKADA